MACFPLHVIVQSGSKNALEAKFIVPDWGMKLTQPTSLRSPAGQYNYPIPESTISSSKGLRIWEQDHADVDVTHLSHLLYL
jgi:hypothetical protein